MSFTTLSVIGATNGLAKKMNAGRQTSTCASGSLGTSRRAPHPAGAQGGRMRIHVLTTENVSAIHYWKLVKKALV
jgi:hypothetical protein